MARQRTLFTTLAVSFLALAACGGDDGDSTNGSTAAPQTSIGSESTQGAAAETAAGAATTAVAVSTVDASAPFPADRCEANRAAGTISYLSSFDFAASASIVDVIVADQRGYFDEMCLDVELTSSFSTANYPLIAANEAQFSSGGSFSEVLDFGAKNGADFVVYAVEGKTAIDGLIVKDGLASSLEDLRGTTIGVKGKITPSVQTMLARAGLVEGTDYQTVLVDGFDPKVHIALPDIVGFPGFKSNEPGQLDRANIPYTLFDPSELDVPGSFGILYSNQAFALEHPTAAEDFVRATMKGLADAIADPDAAAQMAVDLINGNGNPNFLSPEGELFRWRTEAALITQYTPSGQPVGLPDPELLQTEVDAYGEIGLFGDTIPPISPIMSTLLAGLYDRSGVVIWPTS
jgi:ABC-type nitrate/sulfonate/bicarbonate transport system substrate-binding protein